MARLDSHDLNPVDHSMQVRAYRAGLPIRDTDELRHRLVETLVQFQHSVVDDAIDQWQKGCIEALVHAEGDHSEHLP